MRFGTALVTGALIVLAACATEPGAPPPAPAASASGPLDLGGDWRTAAAPSVLTAFEASVSAHYPQGAAINDVVADLRRQNFACTVNSDASHRGEPPAQICRMTIAQDNCTHTWQVHLFAAHGASQISRARGLYDRRCGSEALLGGPGT